MYLPGGEVPELEEAMEERENSNERVEEKRRDSKEEKKIDWTVGMITQQPALFYCFKYLFFTGIFLKAPEVCLNCAGRERI